MNLTEPLWAQARRQPQAEALAYPGHTLRYADLQAQTLHVAAQLQRLGVRAGDVVAVAPDHPLMHGVCLLALAYLGAVSTPAYREMPAPAWARVAAQCRLRGLIYSPGARPWPPAALAVRPGLLLLADTALLAPLPAGCPLPEMAQVDAATPWRLAQSSGTTGLPKLVARSHAQAQGLSQALAPLVPSGPGTRLLVFADLAITYSLNQWLCLLYQGGCALFADGADPAAFLRAAQGLQASHALVSGWSASALAQAAPAWPPFAPLRSLMLGGASVEPAQRQVLLQRVCQQLQNNYGASECGPLALGRFGPQQAAAPGYAGVLTPWTEGQAVDDAHQSLPPGHSGLLRFRSAFASSAYEGDADASAQHFRGGWFYPGDRGHIGADASVYLQGRQDDLINLGGSKIDPQATEALVARQPGVRECAVVGLHQPSMRLAAALVLHPGVHVPSVLAALRRTCAAALPPTQVPQAWLVVAALPRNAQGKLQRHALAEQLERALL